MTSPADIPELGKDAVTWMIEKGLNTMSIGLAMHYYEIQKAWQTCGSGYMCKLEKLMLYFTAIFGGTSPAIAISELAAAFVNKAWGWVQSGDQPLMGKDSWGPTAINMMIYVYIEYLLTKMCDWVRYSTECLKQNVCENDNILVWIYNMKARYCNKTETDVDIDVEVDCLESECLDKEVDVPDVVYKITDNSDWCVIFFNEFPLLLMALLIWSAYIASVHFKDDIEKVKSAKGEKVNGKGKSGSGTSGSDSRSVGKKSGLGRKKKGSGAGKGDSDDKGSDDDDDNDKKDSDDDDGSDKKDSDDDDGSDKKDSDSDTGTDDSDSSKEEGATNKKKRKYTRRKGSSGTKKGDSAVVKSGRTKEAKSESSGAGTMQKIQAKCPTCGKIRDMCMPNPLPVYCDKCGPKMTHKVKSTRKTDDEGFRKCQRKPKTKTNLELTNGSSDDSENDDLSKKNQHFIANDSTKGLTLAVAVMDKMVGDDNSDNHADSSDDNDDELLYNNLVNLAKAHKNQLGSTLKSRCPMCETYHFAHDHDQDSLDEQDEQNNNENIAGAEIYA